MSAQNNPKPKFNIAYSVAKFFLDNTRITILVLALVIIAGISSLIALQPTGFPSPTVNAVIINTFYPGATSETVVKDVTKPIEGAIAQIEGIDTFRSESSNSFSRIVISLNVGIDVDKVISDIQREVNALNFVDGVSQPNIFSPRISGPDVIFAIAGNDRARLFEVYNNFKNDILSLSSTASASAQVSLSQKVVVVLDKDRLRKENIDEAQIKTQLASIGQILPVASNVTINDQNKSISTTLDDVSSLEAIKNFEIFVTPQIIPNQPPFGDSLQSKNIKLGELATVEVQYFYTNSRGEILDDIETLYGFNKQNQGVVLPSVLLNVKAVEGTNLAKFEQELENLAKSYDNVVYASYKEIGKKDFSDVAIIKGYSINEQNQQQVDEVISGLVVGVILVFTLMLIFVSWRAAILASIGIPLSLTFTTIYLVLIGENLNTLVLFSLVLVIGLVVDPALVILESIQRKKDLGLSSKEAVLESMKDVGEGLLISTLTNLIVFLPFALVSGVLGQIFGYIPMTIMPALVGSYIVAIIFLAWLGGNILKKSKNSKGSEEENLWQISKWLIKINEKILNINQKTNRVVSIVFRTVFIVAALIIPLAVTAFLFISGKLQGVQFASGQNTRYLSITGEFLNKIPKAERNQIEKEVLSLINQNEAVYGTIRREEFSYIILLKDRPDRGRFANQTSVDIANQLTQQIQNNYGDKFFDVRVDIIRNGPPTADYQVSLAIKSEDLNILETASVAIGNLALTQVCKTGPSEIQIKEDCPEDKRIVIKVDDGFTNRENVEISIVFDRNKIVENNLYLPNTPLLAFVNQQVSQKYTASGREKVGNINLEGVGSDIIIKNGVTNPSTIEQIENIEINSLRGETFLLKEIASIQEVPQKQNITRIEGETINELRLRLNEENANNQGLAAQVGAKLVEYYSKDNSQKAKELGLKENSVEIFSSGGTAEFTRTFTELGIALILSVFLIYFLLVVFFKSFTMPLTIMFTIPLTFVGVFPAVATFVGNEFGFLEIIGLIILVGLVVNVAIYLIDLANQKIEQGWDPKKAIAFASGVRLRPIFLTNITAVASLAPLFFTSEFYKSIATVIIFGLSSSAVTSLFTTPILFIFFKWLSDKYHHTSLFNRINFLIMPILGLILPFITASIIQITSSDSTSSLMTIISNNSWLNIFYLLLTTPFVYMIIWAVKEIRQEKKAL